MRHLGKLFRLMSPAQQQVLFENTARVMGDAHRMINARHISNLANRIIFWHVLAVLNRLPKHFYQISLFLDQIEGAYKMVCGLDEGELFILNALYGDQCVNKNRSLNLGIIADQFRARFKESPEDVASRLKGKGYITAVPKRAIKYYISDIRRAVYAINSHGGNATKGRILPHKVFRLPDK